MNKVVLFHISLLFFILPLVFSPFKILFKKNLVDKR